MEIVITTPSGENQIPNFWKNIRNPKIKLDIYPRWMGEEEKNSLDEKYYYDKENKVVDFLLEKSFLGSRTILRPTILRPKPIYPKNGLFYIL